jgi:selenocysteine-specific elongation factor
VRATDLDALANAGIPAAAGWLVDPHHARTLAERLAAAVDAHDATDPLDPGLPTEAARRSVDLPDARLLDAVLRFAQRAGSGRAAELVLREGRVARSAAAGLPADVRRALDALRADLQRDPFAAPEAGRLAELGLGQRQLASLVRAGELLRIADGIVLLPGADQRAVHTLRDLGPVFTLSEARQALGTTRRVAVPLLEHLARTGHTVRSEDGGHRLR